MISWIIQFVRMAVRFYQVGEILVMILLPFSLG